MTADLLLKKNVLKNVLIPLELSAGMSAVDGAIQKKVHGSGRPSNLALRTTALINSNEEMEDIMQISGSLEEPGLVTKAMSETIKMKRKDKKADFLQCY